MAHTLTTIRRWDAPLWAMACGLAVAGSLAIASAASTVNPALIWRHGGYMLLGVVVAVGVAHLNYRRWTNVAVAAYGVSLAMLGMVLVAGATRLGATRWISLFGLSVQPSEIAKLTTTWILSQYIAGQPRPLPVRALGISLVLVGAPALLVLVQPDLGSASVFGAIWLAMVWVAGVRRTVLIVLTGFAVAGLPVGWHLLHEYQRNRLLVFINPEADPLGAGYTIIQSTIALGSGQLWGRGWLGGTQNKLRFLPERHSDFIFSVIGEEWGFVGCIGVVVAFGLLLTRALRIAGRAVEFQGRLLAVGLFAWLTYQAFVNMGMAMGVLPVVGLPLPLISYGGTALVTVWTAVGLLQSIHRTTLA